MDASKDIVQDCWSIIINKLGSLKESNFFGSWIFRIVTRKSLDFVSKRKRDVENLEQYGFTAAAVESAEENQMQVQKLVKAIQILSKEQQIVLRLFYTENYNLKEISCIIDISVGTVKSRLFHAREKLKTILKY